MVLYDSNPSPQEEAYASYQIMDLWPAWGTQWDPISSVVKPVHSKHRSLCSAQSSTNKTKGIKPLFLNSFYNHQPTSMPLGSVTEEFCTLEGVRPPYSMYLTIACWKIHTIDSWWAGIPSTSEWESFQMPAFCWCCVLRYHAETVNMSSALEPHTLLSLWVFTGGVSMFRCYALYWCLSFLL